MEAGAKSHVEADVNTGSVTGGVIPSTEADGTEDADDDADDGPRSRGSGGGKKKNHANSRAM